jgi:hypothetical protein
MKRFNYIISIFFLFSVLISSSALAVNYFPIYGNLYTKWKTTYKRTNVLDGVSQTPTTSIEYSWLGNTKTINGLNTLGIVGSQSGYYITGDAFYYESFSSYVSNEVRVYEIYMYNNGTLLNINTYTPYLAVPISIADNLPHSYQMTYTVKNAATNVVAAQYNQNITYQLLGYENITTSFGTYNNCLKYRLTSTSTQVVGCSSSCTKTGYIDTWLAPDIGSVKSYQPLTSSSLTTEFYYSELTQIPNINNILIVSTSGTGSGTISSNPAGISCGPTCSASITTGTSVTLTATPSSGSTFTGWTGSCSGSGTCQMSMDAAKSVIATFALTPTTAKPGDCDNSGTVSIAEVQSSINMFLGLKTVEACVDPDSSSSVSIAEVQKVINSFLGL